MALIAASITVNFLSNYAGQHRVCWRTGGAGAYNCTTLVSCPGSSATPCSVAISITVDNETCTNVDFDGYVQAVCEDEASTNGRVTFSTSFVPDPSCKRYVATCARVIVDSYTMVVKGSGYNAGAPSVNVTGGGGAGATGTAVVGAGVILTKAISGAGAGYINGTYLACPLLGGTGAGAQATVVITGGLITSLSITNAGTGYINTDILFPDTAVVGVPGVAGTITITTDFETITGVTLGSAGVGYTSIPTIAIGAPPGFGGVQATATVVMDPCATFQNFDCGSTGPDLVPAIVLGETVAVCSTSGAPNPGAAYDVVESGNCLCTCENITVDDTTIGSAPINISATYIDCGGGFQDVSIANGGTLTACMVTGSLVITKVVSYATYTETINGSCVGA